MDEDGLRGGRERDGGVEERDGGVEEEGGRDGDKVLSGEEEKEREDLGLGGPALVSNLILFLARSLTYMSLERYIQRSPHYINLYLYCITEVASFTITHCVCDQ